MKRLSIEEIAKMFEFGCGFGDGYGFACEYGSGGGDRHEYGSGAGAGYGAGGAEESPKDLISKKPSRLMVMI